LEFWVQRGGVGLFVLTFFQKDFETTKIFFDHQSYDYVTNAVLKFEVNFELKKNYFKLIVMVKNNVTIIKTKYCAKKLW